MIDSQVFHLTLIGEKWYRQYQTAQWKLKSWKSGYNFQKNYNVMYKWVQLHRESVERKDDKYDGENQYRANWDSHIFCAWCVPSVCYETVHDLQQQSNGKY